MGDEEYRNIKSIDSEGNIYVSKDNERSGSDSVSKKYKLSFKPVDVIILNPSFLCPVLKKPEDDLHIIILTDDKFYNAFKKSEDNATVLSISGAIGRFLKITEWSQIDKNRHADQPIYASLDEIENNIEVHYLWDLSDLDDYKLTDSESKLFAQIHSEVEKMYRNKGLIHGFEVILKNLPLGTGMYDLSWVGYVKPEEEEEEGYFYELQDKMIADFNNKYREGYLPLSCDVSDDDFPLFYEQESEIQSYHPVFISDKECLDVGHLSDVHVSSRQQVFAASKARIIDGEGSDLRTDAIGSMVNVSYATLKNLMKKMAEDTDVLVFTGDLIDYNRNLNPYNTVLGVNDIRNSRDIWNLLDLKNLKDKKLYPLGIDNLVMYELFKWYYETYGKPVVLVSGNHEAYTLPYGISPRIKFFRSLGKALFPGKNVPMVDENGEIIYEEHRRRPIYKNVPLTEEEVIDKSNKEAEGDIEEAEKGDPDIYYDRANEGIPADHNLTIQEAILMYGPDYGRIVMAAASDSGGERNFKPENMTWFYHIFTPMSSFVLSYGGQRFIGLGWGEDEKFVGKKQGEWTIGGFLPRATESISDSQLELLNAAIEDNPSCAILCSHFTYANYNTEKAIKEVGEINTNDIFGTLGKFDYGTFEKNRNDVYRAIADNRIKYTLSGHSHRSGLYQIKDDDISWLPLRDTMSIAAQASDENLQYAPVEGCRMLVAGCGGPIAVQNINNEFYNWGLDYPSGNYIKFSGSTESAVGVKIPDIERARPRLAVALDYADIFLRGDNKNKPGVIEEFYSEDDDGDFILKINKKANIPNGVMLKNANLIFYMEDGQVVRNGIMEVKNRNQESIMYVFKIGSVRRDLKLAIKENIVSYICFKLYYDGDFIGYNYQTEWVVKIKIMDRKEYEERKYIKIRGPGNYDAYPVIRRELESIRKLKGFVIDRDEVYGEIPKFGWYKDRFPDEYR